MGRRARSIAVSKMLKELSCAATIHINMKTVLHLYTPTWK